MILVVSFPGDEHAAAVGRALDAMGRRWAALDLAYFPARVSMALRYGPRRAPDLRLRLAGGRELRLRDVSTVWWRRPRLSSPEGPLREAHRRFALRECEEALAGMWRAAPVRWVDPPEAGRTASWKTWQLAVAREVGLPVPRTLVTNDPAAARAFLSGRRRAIYKAFHGEKGLARGTRPVGGAERRALGALRVAPVIFQEQVAAERDVRVTVAGRALFATAIDARRTSSPWDYRGAWGEARVEPCRLPAPVERAVRRLVARLGLSCAALDLLRRRNGEHVFLEVNPGGQWLGFEARSGQPITAAVARHLAGARR